MFSHVIQMLFYIQSFTFLGVHCRESKQVLCLVFVDQIITAKVIERVFKKFTNLSHFSASYLTGTNNSDALTPKLQKETLESFRSGKVFLLKMKKYLIHYGLPEVYIIFLIS